MDHAQLVRMVERLGRLDRQRGTADTPKYTNGDYVGTRHWSALVLPAPNGRRREGDSRALRDQHAADKAL